MKITPVASLTASGGQYFLDSDPSSFAGNSSIYVAPVFSFSEKSSLVPVFSINYRGTQDVDELVGGGTLTRETADYGTTIKYVMPLSEMKLKTRLSWRQSLVNETKDEDWGDGLFDYSMLLGGVEVGYALLDHDFSTGIDYYNLTFGNYSSLISQDEFETSLDTTTYSELSENAGEDVLDYSNIGFAIGAEKEYSENLKASYSYRLDLKNYKDQTIVEDDGSFSSDKRSDTVNTLRAGVKYRVKRISLNLSNTTKIYSSNQNSFDANAAKYIDDFYSYLSTEFTPGIVFYLGNINSPSRLSLWWAMEFRGYTGRLAQNAEGDYKDDEVDQSDNGFGMSYSYPLMKDFYVTAYANMRTVASNMKYEANYKYNYTVSNYFMGVNWRY